MSVMEDQAQQTDPLPVAQPQKRPKRNRKDYMHQYYLKHKSPMTCDGCGSEFACRRSLKHHEDNNIRCLMGRLKDAWGHIRDQLPVKEAERIDSEMERVKQVIKKEGSREGSKEEKQKNVELKVI